MIDDDVPNISNMRCSNTVSEMGQEGGKTSLSNYLEIRCTIHVRINQKDFLEKSMAYGIQFIHLRGYFLSVFFPFIFCKFIHHHMFILQCFNNIFSIKH